MTDSFAVAPVTTMTSNAAVSEDTIIVIPFLTTVEVTSTSFVISETTPSFTMINFVTYEMNTPSLTILVSSTITPDHVITPTTITVRSIEGNIMYNTYWCLFLHANRVNRIN